MIKLLCTDWVEYFFHYFSLKFYEKKQEKHRKQNNEEKNKIVRNNRIIVKVNDTIIYDSKKEKNMSDELYYALLSYGLKDSINSQPKNKKSPIYYNITPSISALPVFFDQYLEKDVI